MSFVSPWYELCGGRALNIKYLSNVRTHARTQTTYQRTQNLCYNTYEISFFQMKIVFKWSRVRYRTDLIACPMEKIVLLANWPQGRLSRGPNNNNNNNNNNNKNSHHHRGECKYTHSEFSTWIIQIKERERERERQRRRGREREISWPSITQIPVRHKFTKAYIYRHITDVCMSCHLISPHIADTQTRIQKTQSKTYVLHTCAERLPRSTSQINQQNKSAVMIISIWLHIVGVNCFFCFCFFDSGSTHVAPNWKQQANIWCLLLLCIR